MRAAFHGLIMSVLLFSSKSFAQAVAAPVEGRDWRYVLTIFEIAAADDDAKLSQLLTDNPDRVLLRVPNTGTAAVHVATESGALKSLRVLSKAGADLNVVDQQGRTPLSMACGTHFASTVKTLLDLGADPNKEGADTANAIGQFTGSGSPDLPLSIAAKRGYTDIVKLLIAGKADVNKRASNETTPLLAAAAAGKWDIAELLIDNGADVNAADKSGMTLLLYAAAASDEKQVAYLLSKGADAKVADKTGRNGLSLTQSAPIWKMLVPKGADVNVVVGGRTPLQYFIDQGNLELVKVWLDFKPDPFITDRQGHTAKELARAAASRGYSPTRQEIAQLVETYQNKYAADQLAKEPVSQPAPETQAK